MEKNESNITRDHLAMEAMKVIMEKSVRRRLSLKGKIKSLFGKPVVERITMLNPVLIADVSYRVADAMIAARRQAEDKEEGGGNE